MNTEVLVGTVDELPEGTHKLVNVEGREMGIFNVRGNFYAIPNACFHQNGPLCLGAISGTVVATKETLWKTTWSQDGEVIVCPWHSLEFNITTGQCLAHPKKKLNSHQLRVEKGQIFFPLHEH